MPPASGSAPHQAVTDAAGALRPELTTTRDPTGDGQDPRSSLLPLPDEQYRTHAATTTEDLAALAPQVPAQVRRDIDGLDPELDGDLAEWKRTEPLRPRLRVLGPVELQVAVAPVGDVARRPAFNAELVAYLLAHPHGATPAETAEALGCQTNTIHSRITGLRTWLGAHPTTGELYLPVSPLSPGGRARGVPVYQAVGVLCDADLFRRLRARGQARGAEGIGDLAAALELVSGRPFDHLRAEGYGWLAETPTHHHLTVAVVDVAHIVSTHYLTAGQPDRAAWAAEKGMLAAPSEDRPRLDLAAAHRALGGARTESAESDLRGRRGVEDEDPPPRTTRILGQGDEG